MERRQFLQLTGGTALAGVALSKSQGFAAEPSLFQLQAWLPNGEPLGDRALNQLYFLDLQDEPWPNPPRQIQSGSLWSEPPCDFPFAIALRLPVNGFGEVALYADNQGQGYTPADFPLNLNLAFAQSRLYRVEQTIKTWRTEGYTFAQTIHNRLDKAKGYLQRAETTDDTTAIAGWCNGSLVESLWAGEEAALNRAQQRIQQQQPLRQNFLWGCNFFGFPRAGVEYTNRFQQLFNFATVPFYWRSFEPTFRQPNYARVDTAVQWLTQAGITPKGHPLVWFHEAGIPDWLRDQPYARVLELTEQRVQDITTHYKGQIPYYDILNETNGRRFANELGYSSEQLLEISQVVARAAKSGDPNIQRIINSCCLWAEHVAYDRDWLHTSPYQYIKDCVDAEVLFEIIGLQVYYPQQDMFEIDRLLDRFSQFGKPLHITELGVSSDTGIDEDSILQEARGLWHAPWSETIQADWLEQFYTLCYSKPLMEAISWWNFSDKEGVFWPFSGLLDDQLQPKEAFYRLQNLINRWQNPFS